MTGLDESNCRAGSDAGVARRFDAAPWKMLFCGVSPWCCAPRSNELERHHQVRSTREITPRSTPFRRPHPYATPARLCGGGGRHAALLFLLELQQRARGAAVEKTAGSAGDSLGKLRGQLAGR